MMSALPTGGFAWVEDPSSIKVEDLDDDGSDGYFLEVDMDYPEELHDVHSDYPLAPERMKVTKDMLSPYSCDLLDHLKMNHISCEKLVPNLQHKNNYVLHSRILKLYLKLGLRLTKIHRALKFKQSPWLKAYIDFNTDKRKEAKSNFEKDLWKLLNNAVFGKSMENPRKHRQVELVNTPKRLRKCVAKPTFHTFRIFSEELVGVEHRKATVHLDKPIYVGSAILDISKTYMYSFHYEHMVPKYGDKLTLQMTDTDSLMYHVLTEDIYKDMAEDPHLYDFSDYPKDHPLYSEENKKVPGKFKDEVSKGVIQETVGLRPKCYSAEFYINGQISVKKTAKGVNKTAKKKRLRHEDYRNCLLQKVPVYTGMNRIQSERHQMYTVHTTKLGLSPADDKRYVLRDGIRTLAYGHYRIPLIESSEMDWEDVWE